MDGHVCGLGLGLGRPREAQCRGGRPRSWGGAPRPPRPRVLPGDDPSLTPPSRLPVSRCGGNSQFCMLAK